jgi:hypothetical protein
MRVSRACGRFGWALLGLLPAALQSQPVYRCGNTYSQLPCAQAIVVTVDDGRTSAQKTQADVATAQAARLADRMERDRLASERRAATAKVIGAAGQGKAQAPTRATPPATKSATGKGAAKNKAAAPDYFTASTRQEGPGKTKNQTHD